ncbi:NAD(P)-bd_dom domain-containing protein [Pycnococcus provasolii]
MPAPMNTIRGIQGMSHHHTSRVSYTRSRHVSCGRRHSSRSSPSAVAVASSSSSSYSGTVLVAGATGGVGQIVCARLLQQKNCKVKALVRDASRASEILGTDPSMEFVVADLRDANSLLESGATEGINAVISCLGTTAFPSARWKDDNGPENTDFVAVRNLVNATKKTAPDLSRFVLVSSVGVERTNQMPFIILNAFGVLKYKKMGEDEVKNSGLPYTLLRPGRLTDGPYTSYDLNTLLKATSGTRRAVQVGVGDTLLPEATSRIIVAEAAVQCLTLPCTLGGAYELGSTEGEGPREDPKEWTVLFESASASSS